MSFYSLFHEESIYQTLDQSLVKRRSRLLAYICTITFIVSVTPLMTVVSLAHSNMKIGRYMGDVYADGCDAKFRQTFSIRYPDPAIKVNDTVKIDLSNGKITDFIKFDTGTIAMVTGGRNMGRVGVITHRERHDGGFNIVHLKDAVDNEFATRESNVFVIGHEKPWISLPKGKGVKVSIQTLNTDVDVLANKCSSRLQKRETVVERMLWLDISWTKGKREVWYCCALLLDVSCINCN